MKFARNAFLSRLMPIVFVGALAGLLSGVQTAAAETISGEMINDGPDLPLRLHVGETDATLEIQTIPSLIDYLRRMKTGDQLTAQGTVDQSRLLLESIDRIGLQELLGAWRSSRWEIFEFKDFNQLNLYIPTVEAGQVALSQTHSLKYVVTPEQEDRFSIFISDDNDVRMGFIEVGKNKLTLSVTDFKTGQTTENISLSPLLMQ